MKRQEGITLVALVVTIIVLIILAGVTINTLLNENGIIQRAKEASIDTDVTQTKEQIQLELLARYSKEGKYTNADVVEIVKQITGKDVEEGSQTTTTKKGNPIDISDLWVNDSEINNIWTQDKTTVTNGRVTLEVGQSVSGYTGNNVGDGNWCVLGAQNGELLITTNSNQGIITLTGQDGYTNGINILNDAAEVYNDGNMAEIARSINIEDINRVTGYDPDVAKYNEGTSYPYQWKNEVTYTLNASDLKIHCQGTKYPTNDTVSEYTSFSYWNGSNWETLDAGESVKITHTHYYYYPQTLSTTESSETQINGSTSAYHLLFSNTSNEENYYWLASQYTLTDLGICGFGIGNVGNGRVNGRTLYNSDGTTRYPNFDRGLRPVVSLKSNVRVTSSGTLSI